MKNENVLAHKYIQAFTNTLSSNKAVSDLEGLVTIWKLVLNNAEYKEYFFSPMVKSTVKQALMTKIVEANGLSEQAQNFIFFIRLNI